MSGRQDFIDNSQFLEPTANEPEIEVHDSGVRRRFFLWFAVGFLPTVAMLFLGSLYSRTNPYPFHEGPPWPTYAISWLFWLQVIHAICGQLLVRGERGAVVGGGIFQVFVALLVGWYTRMVVTGSLKENLLSRTTWRIFARTLSDPST
jgi:hypothetical protein